MPVIRFTGFNGANRALHPKLLPETVCTDIVNAKPGRGDLRPWRQPLNVGAAVTTGHKTIYRMGRDVASDSQYWLSWNAVVHAVRGMESGETAERTYFTGDGAPKVTDTTMALTSTPYPTATRPMGLPAPASALTATVNAGTWEGDTSTVFFVYTYVNDWGWESAPSAVSAQHDRPSDATSTLTGIAAPPSGNYQINRIRIYQTQEGASGSGEFFFLREVAIGTTSTTADGRALGEIIPTQRAGTPGSAWTMPDASMTFLTPLWNGMLAGIDDDGHIRFSEPFVPYAWPLLYDLAPVDCKAIALGAFGQSLLVLTDGRPMLVSGSSPEAMDMAPLEIPQACISTRSVAGMGSGVAWASNDGLCWYGAGGAKILTAGLMTREQWGALRPNTIIGRMYEGLYLGSYDDGGGRKAFMIDPMNPTGLYFLDVGYEAMHFDELQDQLYVLSGANVQRWDAGTFMTVRATSKEFRAPRPMNFGWAEVLADAYPLTVHFDWVNLAASEVTKLVTAKPFLSAPVATTLRYTATVTSRNPFKLPSGFLADDFQMSISTTGAAQVVTMATSIDELKNT